MSYKNIPISIIAAMDSQGLIGVNNRLPWGKLNADMKRFRELTLNSLVVMGRKTYESINSNGVRFEGLPDRLNSVITSKAKDLIHCYSNLMFSYNMENALCEQILNDDFYFKLFDLTKKEIFVIGGASIYKQFLDLGIVDNLYLTKIAYSFRDAEKGRFDLPEMSEWIYFPTFDKSLYTEEIQETITNEAYKYTFVNYRKK